MGDAEIDDGEEETDVLSPCPVEFVSDDPTVDGVDVVAVVLELVDEESRLVEELWLEGRFIVVVLDGENDVLLALWVLVLVCVIRDTE